MANETREYFHGPAKLRTVEEIEAAWQEMFDRRWYDRSKMLAPDDPRAALQWVLGGEWDDPQDT